MEGVRGEGWEGRGSRVAAVAADGERAKDGVRSGTEGQTSSRLIRRGISSERGKWEQLGQLGTVNNGVSDQEGGLVGGKGWTSQVCLDRRKKGGGCGWIDPALTSSNQHGHQALAGAAAAGQAR